MTPTHRLIVNSFMEKSGDLSASELASAHVVWDYLRMNHSVEGSSWDGVLCLCSSDLTIAAHAAALHRRLGGWLCFSGGYGAGPHSVRQLR